MWWNKTIYKSYWSIEALEGLSTQRLKKELQIAINNKHTRDITNIQKELLNR